MVSAAQSGHEPSIEALEGAPVLLSSDMIYWDAYGYLNSERQPTMGGISAIPWSKIKDYGEFYHMSDWQIDLLIDVVMAMDAVTVDYHNKKAAKKAR